MNKFKKALISIVATATVATNVVGLSACGGGKEPFSYAAYDGSKVEITFYHTMGQKLQGVLSTYIGKFQEIYPNITVTATMMGDYPALRNAIATELTAQNSPSLAYCYPDHVALYNKSKKVVTLDEYINMTSNAAAKSDGSTETMGLTAEQKADFIEGYYNEGMAYGDGKMYTLPFSKSTEVLYYNKTFLAENNLLSYVEKADGKPMTWDEMEALCAAIKAVPGCENDIPLGYDSEANWFITMTEQLGTPYTSTEKGNEYLFNNEDNHAFVTRFVDWYHKGYVTTEEIYGSYTSELFTETASGTQKSYLCIGSSAGASYQIPDLDGNNEYPFEVGVTQIPQVNPDDPKCIQQGPSICIFQKPPQEAAAAWLFAKYLTTSVPFQAQFSMSNGYTPVIKSVQADPTYAAFLAADKDIEGNVLTGAAKNVNLQATVVKHTLSVDPKAFYISPAFNGSSAARDQVGILLQSCFTGTVDIKNDKTAIAEYVKTEFAKTIDTLNYESA